MEVADDLSHGDAVRLWRELEAATNPLAGHRFMAVGLVVGLLAFWAEYPVSSITGGWLLLVAILSVWEDRVFMFSGRTDCRVLATWVARGWGTAIPVVLYEYDVGGVLYRGYRVRWNSTYGPEGADKLRRRYRPGERRRCFYRRREPTEAVLDPTLSPWIWVYLLLALLGSALVVGGSMGAIG